MDFVGTVELAALTQGVAFLYTQAGDLLKRRREARAGKVSEDSLTLGEVDQFPALEPPQGVFEPAVEVSPYPDLRTLEREASQLLEARRAVEPYTLGDAALDPTSESTLRVVDQLRNLIEQIYGADLTFKGESRSRSGSPSASSSDQRGGITAGTIVVNRDFAMRDINNYR